MSTNNSVNFGNLPAITVATGDKVVISDASDYGLMKVSTAQSIRNLAQNPNIKALFFGNYIIGDTIYFSYNISSVTDLGSNLYGLNFSIALSTADYAVSGNTDYGIAIIVTSNTISSCTVENYLGLSSSINIVGVANP